MSLFVRFNLRRRAKTFYSNFSDHTKPSSPEQVVHDVLVVLHLVLRQVAGCEQDDGVHLISIVT